VTSQPTHTLVVTCDPDHPSDDPDELRYGIRCDGVTDWCRSFEECLAEGCDRKALEEAELDGDDEPEAHGVVHRNIGNLGWSVEVADCALRFYDWLDEARDLKLQPGEYRFTHRWEDGGEWFSFVLAEEAL
jgi:hypothetical protein